MFQPAPKICPSQRGLICFSGVLIVTYVVSVMLTFFTTKLERVTQSCGAKPVTRVLFSLRRRACKSCMKAQYVTTFFRSRSPSNESVQSAVCHLYAKGYHRIVLLGDWLAYYWIGCST